MSVDLPPFSRLARLLDTGQCDDGLLLEALVDPSPQDTLMELSSAVTILEAQHRMLRTGGRIPVILARRYYRLLSTDGSGPWLASRMAIDALPEGDESRVRLIPDGGSMLEGDFHMLQRTGPYDFTSDAGQTMTLELREPDGRHVPTSEDIARRIQDIRVQLLETIDFFRGVLDGLKRHGDDCDAVSAETLSQQVMQITKSLEHLVLRLDALASVI